MPDKWTKQEIMLLTELWSNNSFDYISSFFDNRTSISIEAKARRLKLLKDRDYISKNNKRARNLNTKVSIRRYMFDDNFFSVIDDEYKAYILGWVWSDGYITSDKRRWGISISIKDIDILKIMLYNMKSNYPIRKFRYDDGEYKMCRFDISSNKAVLDLERLGICSNKTYSNNTPINIPENMIHHFIRGFFDGDGCITGRNKVYASIKIATSIEISNWLKIRLGNMGSISKKINSNICYSYDINGARQIQRVYEFLYSDATIYLSRKFNKFKELGYSLPCG